MKYGHKINLKIENYDQKGRGIGFIEILPGESRAIAVPFAAQGDDLETTFFKREYGTKICKLDKVTEASPDRITPPCSHAGICGGCLWQHLSYKAQLVEKMRGIKDLFLELNLQDKLQDIIPAEQTLGYRNRMDFALGWNGEIGLKEYGSWNRYVDIKECLLMQPEIGNILQTVRDWMKQFDLQPWDVKFHTGDLRYLVIRDGKNTEQRMVSLIVSDATRLTNKARNDLKQKILDLNNTTSLLIGEQNKPADLSLAQSYEAIIGNAWLDEEINCITYRIHPNSFFQTNSSMASKLQSVVLGAINNSQTKIYNLLDLYCGIGFLGIAAAKKIKSIKKISGFEIDEHAIELASQNAELNKVGDRCSFTSGKAEDLSWKNIPADLIILDPPRSGLHPRVIKTLLDEEKPLAPYIVYVSCNYHRLKEELPAFLEKYSVQSIQPLDLFPQTPHVEVVVVMKKS